MQAMQQQGINCRQHLKPARVWAICSPFCKIRLCAGEHEVFDYAHIHRPAVDGKKQLVAEYTGLPSMTGLLTTAKAGQDGTHEEGIMDMEAYTDYEATEQLNLEEPDSQDDEYDTEAQEDQDGTQGQLKQGRDTAMRLQRVGWMHQDFSGLMAEEYEQSMQQVGLVPRFWQWPAAAPL